MNTRSLFQRALGLIYFNAFLIAANQYLPLLGEHGLLPVRLYLPHFHFWKLPGLLHWNCSDPFITGLIYLGLALAFLTVTGVSERFGVIVSATIWALLWMIYLSLVNAGQVFYGFGWETILLEVGFLAIFLSAPSRLVMWLLLWVQFRIMFGAGMIKIRGDSCWRDLTCMLYHYETQPLPNPLSWYFHHLPVWFHKLEIVFTHFVELIVPWFLLTPWRRGRMIAGALTAFFQFMLILSGNLSWLNYITIVLCIPCFDFPNAPAPRAHRIAVYALAVLIAGLSVRPAMNLFSSRQVMNASFEPLHLVNTYGAFGAVGRQRPELVIEGTTDGRTWREYEFKGKPGHPQRRPGIVSPYHYKLDWQMWFAAMGSYQNDPWIINLIAKLLQNDRPTLSLLADNPFPDHPPRFIRVTRYRYHFTDSRRDGWWRREPAGEYLPPVSLENLRPILERMDWR